MLVKAQPAPIAYLVGPGGSVRIYDGTDAKELVGRMNVAPNTLVRIACHELENWYLGDLVAVEKALAIPSLSARQNKARYRSPDEVVNAADELERLTQGRYQKVGGSRAIGPHLDPDNNRSHSFAVFVAGVKRLVAGQ
jgi:hypothetical protein